jgi:type 1 glutamine amidotransferase
MKNKYISVTVAFFLVVLMISCKDSLNKTLIVTGQGTHNWMASSDAVKQILDQTGLFSTRMLIAPSKGEDMSGFNPKFSRYKLIVIDYEGDPWPEQVVSALTEFVEAGGGVLVFNSAGSPFVPAPDSVTVSARVDFEVRSAAADHPVLKGLPARWVHPADVLVRGVNITGEGGQVLATAAAGGPQGGGSRRPVPVMTARTVGEGRVFVTMLGAPDEEESKAMHCAGFITTLQRAAEWAATGTVTQDIPSDFPTAAGAVIRSGFKPVDQKEAFENIGNYDITQSTKYFTWLQAEIRKAAGDETELLALEKKMVDVLKNSKATSESKKLLLKELSWMGSEYCIPVVKEMGSDEELKEAVDFVLERLQKQ